MSIFSWRIAKIEQVSIQLVDFERLPGGVARGGILTPATGLGDVLVERLRQAGMELKVEMMR